MRLQETPGHLIRRLHQRSSAVFLERIRATQYDLTSVQYAALITLAEHPGTDQAGLAAMIAYDRATIGGVVQRLEQKGLVERRIDDEDRRARKLQLTGAGIAAIDALTPAVEELQATILEKLTDAERATLMELMGKAIAD